MTYLLKRLLGAVPLLLGITFISFSIMIFAPGDPTNFYKDPHVTEADLAQIRENLGLNDPFYVQYGKWLKELSQGNLGYSIVSGQPVLTAIKDRIPATLLLSIPALLLIVMLTFPLGLLSGYKHGSWFDHAVTFFSFFGMALPTFWVGLVFILIFSVNLGWFPTSGFSTPSLVHATIWVRSWDIMCHMVLPLMTIVIGGLAGLTRYLRFGVISILAQEYIKAARARGISERRLLFKHAFKNACLPVITILGLQLPGLIGGSFVIEFIFAWPGMGKLGVDSVFARDYPVLMGILLFSSLLIILGNLLSDMLYAKVDPRIVSS